MSFSTLFSLFLALVGLVAIEADAGGPAATLAMEAPSPGTAVNSGLEGTTRSVVVGGMRGGRTTGGLTSVEFAIAPIEGGRPAYDKAIFVKSDRDGRYRVDLPPGRYWIGPKAKALDPVQYRPQATVFREEEALVTEGTFSRVDLSEVGYAP